MLKLIGLYVSFDGDLATLYNYLINKSPILNILQKHMVIRKIFIFFNDPKKKPKEIVENMTKFKTEKGKEEIFETKKSTYDGFKNVLLGYREIFENYLNQSKNDQCLLRFENEEFEPRQTLNINLLGKKRQRERHYYKDEENNDSQKTQDTKEGKKGPKKFRKIHTNFYGKPILNH